MLRIRMILANGRFWSGVLAAASFSRGTAYIERPPVSTTVASGAIEAFIPYQAWGIILLGTVIGIVLGHCCRSFRNLGIVAHLISMWAYGTFGVSTAAASIYSGQSWGNLGLLITQAILHAACAIYLGDEIARTKQEVQGE